MNLDGFILTHMIEPVEYEDDDLIKKYLPEFKMKNALHPDQSRFHGLFCDAGNIHRGADEPRGRH